MIAKCNKCNTINPYEINDVKDTLSPVKEIDIFGNKKNIITGIIRCNNCGAEIEVKSRKEIENEYNKKIK